MLHAHHFNNAQRGNHVLYRHGETNHCPGCGRSHWIIGRITAECAFCATAIQLQEASVTRDVRILERGRRHPIHTPSPYMGIIRRGKGSSGLR